ncbi:hypothetical protein ABFS82_13G100600 [Erythranthe guttata]
MFPMKKMSVVVTTISLLIIASCLNNYAQATDYIHQLRLKAAKHNMTCVLVFGDSSVDPGNNNYISTSIKSNFLPYGEDFFKGRPSGRFCNGRLATDFIAGAFGYTNLVRAFLDPAITKKDLLHGVSFASADSGYDELTANLSNVLSISKQLDYLRHYKIHLRNIVGSTKESEKIVKNSLFIELTAKNPLNFGRFCVLPPERKKVARAYLNSDFLSTDVQNVHFWPKLTGSQVTCLTRDFSWGKLVISFYTQFCSFCF